MSKGRWAFRPKDIARAIKGAVSAGAEISRAEIDPATGKIVLIFGKSVASDTGPLTSGTAQHSTALFPQGRRLSNLLSESVKPTPKACKISIHAK